MVTHLFGSRLRIAAAAALMGLFCAGAAYAAPIYRGSFDPIDFMGIADFDLDPNCVPLSGEGFVSVPSCGNVDILDVTITNQPALDETLTFAPPTLTGEVTGLFWHDFQLVGVDTFIFGPQVGQTGPGVTFDPFTLYGLQFVSGFINSENIGPPSVNLYACGSIVTFESFVVPESAEFCTGGEVQGVANTVTFERVPEPATIALILVALAAGWTVRRKALRA